MSTKSADISKAIYEQILGKIVPYLYGEPALWRKMFINIVSIME
jgi:hypothetical protein